jgi:hypothetical protein
MASTRYENNMRGVLFKNDKEGVPQRADYRGSAEVNGIQYFLDAWINTSKAGEKFMSLRFKLKTETAPPSRPQADVKPQIDFDDDIPF